MRLCIMKIEGVIKMKEYVVYFKILGTVHVWADDSFDAKLKVEEMGVNEVFRKAKTKGLWIGGAVEEDIDGC